MHDALQLIGSESNKTSVRFRERKEDVTFSGLLFSRKQGIVKQKKVVLTNKAMYFLQKSSWICNQSGITFGQKFPVSEFRELTIDTRRLCLVIHTSVNDDDIMLQMENLSLEEFAVINYPKLAENPENSPEDWNSAATINYNPTEVEKLKMVILKSQSLQEA